jgi:hypothetical protein
MPQPTSKPLASRVDESTENSNPPNPIWQAAIEKYYAELRQGGLKEKAISKDLWNIESPDDLLTQIEKLAPPESESSKIWTRYTDRLRPTLLGLGDFMAWIALLIGMNGRVAAIMWGSIRLIVQVS